MVAKLSSQILHSGYKSTARRSPSELVAVGGSGLQELGTSSLKLHRKSPGYSNTKRQD